MSDRLSFKSATESGRK